MITNYLSLRVTVADYLARDDLTDRIKTFVQIAESKANRLRIRQLEVALNTPIASQVIAVPADYREMKFLYRDGNPIVRLERMSLEQLYRNFPTRAADAGPVAYAREVGNFIFGPAPDSAYTIRGVYYRQPTAMSADTDTHWSFTFAPELLLYGALVEASPFIKEDPRIAVWAQLFQATVQDLKREDKAEDHSGSVLRQRRA